MTIYSDPDTMIHDMLWAYPLLFQTRGDFLYTVLFSWQGMKGHYWTDSGLNIGYDLTQTSDPIMAATDHMLQAIKSAKSFYNLLENADDFQAELNDIVKHYTARLKTINSNRANIDDHCKDYTLTRKPVQPGYFKGFRHDFLFYKAPPTISAEWQLELMYAQENWLPLHHSTHYLDVT